MNPKTTCSICPPVCYTGYSERTPLAFSSLTQQRSFALWEKPLSHLFFRQRVTYELSTLHVNLSCAASHAVIHYTIDGTEPTADSPIYHREAGLIPVKHTDGAESITIRAFAQADGLQPSDTVAFTYRFACRPKGVFRHSLLREPSDTAAGLIRIEDFDLDRMYLIIGQKRAALIDAGWDYDGNLPALCHALTGGLPVDLLIAHGHPDHVAQAGKIY